MNLKIIIIFGAIVFNGLTIASPLGVLSGVWGLKVRLTLPVINYHESKVEEVPKSALTELMCLRTLLLFMNKIWSGSQRSAI